jgi:hypothetical protein
MLDIHIYNRCTRFKYTDTFKKTARMLIWGSHRQPRVAKVKLSVANDETGFKVLTLKSLLECITENKQTVNRET